MKTHLKTSKLLVFVLIFQLSLPGVVWSQQSLPVKQPEAYQPYLIVDGILVPDEELIHLPKYRNDYARGFADQQQVQLVDYSQVVQWKKKNKPREESSHDGYLVEARDSLASGKKAYQQLDFEKALEQLTHSKNEFIRNLSHLRSNRDLLEAHLYLGMTYIALIKNPQDDNEKQAVVELEKVVMLDPQRELASASFSPKVIQMFEKVKQRLTANNRITVKIDANVPQAKVYINGKLLGPTPMKARLIPGDYYFLFERKGMLSWSQLITLKDTVEHVTANMQGAAENADWNSMFQIREGTDQQTANMDELKDLARAVGGELIVLSNMEKIDNSLRLLGQLYDVRTQEFSQVAIVDIGKDTSDFAKPMDDFEPAAYDMAKALSSMVRPDGYLINSGQSLTGMDPMRIAPEQPQTVEQHDAPKAKLYEHWWFWAGVAAIGAGAYFGIKQLGGTSGSSIIIDNQGNF